MEFHTFQIQDKPTIDAFVKPLKLECSELTFTNMIIWGQDGKMQWAVQDDVLYVRLQFGSHPPFFFPPVPKDVSMDYGKAISAASDHLRGEGATPMFRSISGIFVKLFEKYAPDFVMMQDRNTFDYVYRAEDLITLRGKKLHSKRNHINQFKNNYRYAYRPLQPDMIEDCMSVYLNWLQEKDVFEPGILGELQAIKFLLPNMEALGVKGGAIYVEDKLTAFTIGEQIRENMALIHIEKADANVPGLYAMINQQFVENTWSGLELINREEDMGIEGMRKAKLSYHPVRMIEKYTAKPKS